MYSKATLGQRAAGSPMESDILDEAGIDPLTSICCNEYVLFPLLVVKGTYHYWKELYLFQWA